MFLKKMSDQRFTIRNCIESGCPFRAGFGEILDGYPQYCFKHCKIGMVNFFGMMCYCGKIATHNFSSSNTHTPRFCKEHALNGMIDILPRIKD